MQNTTSDPVRPFIPETANRDLLDVEIAEALATLIKRYPGQRVRLSAVVEPGKPAIFFAGCEHVTRPFDSQSEMGDSPHTALERLIAVAGDHNQLDTRKIKIQQLEEELAGLRRGLRAVGAIPAGDECTLLPHERGLTGEPQ